MMKKATAWMVALLFSFPAYAGRGFNGSSDKLLSTAGAAVTGLPATICGWVRPNTTTAEREIAGVSRSTSLTPLFRIGMTSTGKPFAQFRDDGSTASKPVGTTTLSTTSYQLICGTFATGGTITVFFNGTQEASAGATFGAITVDQTEVGVLQRSSAGQFWDGDIAGVAFWNVVLSDAEIAALASGVSPTRIRPTSLVGHFPVWGAQSPEPDLSGGGKDLTVTGTTVVDHCPCSEYVP